MALQQILESRLRRDAGNDEGRKTVEIRNCDSGLEGKNQFVLVEAPQNREKEHQDLLVIHKDTTGRS